MRTPLIALTAAAVTGGALLVAPSPAAAVDPVNTSQLRQAVTVNGILSHMRALQRVANENDGTRASGTPGYNASARYVRGQLEAAGYEVTEQTFTFPYFQELAPSELAQVSPTPTTYAPATMQYSGSGTVTGQLVPTRDVLVPPPATSGSTSGCEPADFVPASATQPQIALVQRGTCTFEIKAANAQAAGYDAVLIFNEGQEGRTETLEGTLGRAFTLPVLGLSFEEGRALYRASQAGRVVVRAAATTDNRPNAVTKNLLAQTRGGDPDKVVVVGAHLDSVQEGPGINDNGSGTATILEIARQMARLKVQPQQKVRFAFWGAEESGLLGAEHYVSSLSDRGLSRIYANLNFDMLGSPNYARFVYDGDGSASAASPAGPPGSAQIERIFSSYFSVRGLASEPTAFDGRSDYGPFIAVGIPAGGLFSGAEGIKTPAQAKRYGGTADAPYDACYHQACDTITNVSTRALAELGDAAAHATMTLALTKEGFFVDGSRAQARTAQALTAQRSADFRGTHLLR